MRAQVREAQQHGKHAFHLAVEVDRVTDELFQPIRMNGLPRSLLSDEWPVLRLAVGVEMNQRHLYRLAIGRQRSVESPLVSGSLSEAKPTLAPQTPAISSTRCSSVGSCGTCSATSVACNRTARINLPR
jgi:hypothetical protein